jgi:hypothetical protein
LQQVFRFIPAFPVNVPHVNEEEIQVDGFSTWMSKLLLIGLTQFDGFVIPPKTMIFVNASIATLMPSKILCVLSQVDIF